MSKCKRFIGESAEQMFTRFLKSERPIISEIRKFGDSNNEIDLIYE